MKFIGTVSDVIFKIEKILASLFGTILLFSVSAGVLFRYVLNAPLVWADEVAILSLVWITFIGASMGVKTQSSAAITFLVDRLSSTSRKIVITIGNVFTLIFIGTIIYLCFQWLSSPNIAVQKTDTLELPMIYGYISVPIGFICMFIHLISITLSVSEEDRGVNA